MTLGMVGIAEFVQHRVCLVIVQSSFCLCVYGQCRVYYTYHVEFHFRVRRLFQFPSFFLVIYVEQAQLRLWGRTHNVTQRMDTHIFTGGGTHPQCNPTNEHTYLHRGGGTHPQCNPTNGHTNFFWRECAHLRLVRAHLWTDLYRNLVILWA